jgi:ABC-type Na+ efflux pump permease subunit
MAGWFIIAKWELLRSKQQFNKKTLMLLFFFLIMLIAAAYAVAQTDMNMNKNIYRIAVTDPILKPVFETEPRFDVTIIDRSTAQNMQQNDADIVIIDQNIYQGPTEKSASASDALENALKNYRESVLIGYNDINNTHPVWLNIHYIERKERFDVLDSTREEPDANKGSAASENTDLSGLNADGVITTEPSIEIPKNIEQIQQINSRSLLEKQKIATPSYFAPPIPFTAVMYSFLFLFPIYFVSQFYSSSIMDERINKNCELLLVAPLRSVDIILGKTTPYILACMMILGIVTIYIKGLPLSIEIINNILLILVIIFPVVLLFFAVSFFCAILARSYKELTFAMVFISVVVSGYLFFPAMFANIHTISLISPITLVVHLIEGNTIKISEYLFSTLPFYFTAISFFGFGTFIFREEDLFTQKPITEKLLDCIEMYLVKPFGSVFTLSAIVIPYVYMAQLMLIVMLFNLPLPYSVIAMIILCAFIEELAKSVGIFTLLKRKIVPPTVKNAVILAILAGAGFFIGEKLLLVMTLTPITTSVFGLVMSMGTLLLIPLIIHITGAMIVSLGIYARGVRYYLPLIVMAGMLHSLYNIYILRGILFE